MKNPTELMRSILTNEKAQEMIDYVSPVYGDSYVGLWIFQSIGAVLGEICKIGEQLRYETTTATTDLLLDLWEAHYGIPSDTTLTKDQRRARLIAKTQSRGPCNPVKLAAAVSGALGGVQVKITENVAKNTFLVSILEGVRSTAPAIEVLDRMKPAHLIYTMETSLYEEVSSGMKTAVAVTQATHYEVEVQQQ